MTTVELRTSILTELDQMSVEMLENVSHYVKRLRRHTRPASRDAVKETVPDIVLSLLGAGEPRTITPAPEILYTHYLIPFLGTRAEKQDMSMTILMIIQKKK